jgi:hypothetical protein
MRINGKRQIQQGTIIKDLLDLSELGKIIELIGSQTGQGNAELTIKTLDESSQFTLVNKDYVDSHIQSALQGLKIKRGVNGVIDGSNKTLQSITNPTDGTRILLLSQYTDGSNTYNAGVYLYDGNSNSWVYQSEELEDGAYWFVKDDNDWSIAKSGWGYICTDPSVPEIEQFTGVGQLTAGAGINLDASKNEISVKVNTDELKLDNNGIGILKVSSDKIDLSNVSSGKYLIKDPNTGKISGVDITAKDPILFTGDKISIKDASTTQKGVVTLSDDTLPSGTVITADVLKQKINTLIKTYEVTAGQDGSVSITLEEPTNSTSVYAVYVNGLRLGDEYTINKIGNQIDVTSSEIYANDIVIVDVIQI